MANTKSKKELKKAYQRGAYITNAKKAHAKRLVSLAVKRFTATELKSILDKHEAWTSFVGKGPYVLGQDEGKRMLLDSIDLRGTDFRKRNLEQAEFRCCRFDGADFTGAKLISVYFSGCDLRGAKGIHSAVLNQRTHFGGFDLLPRHLQRSLRNRMRRVAYHCGF